MLLISLLSILLISNTSSLRLPPLWIKLKPQNHRTISISIPKGLKREEELKKIHETFMDLALIQAQEAGKRAEVPIGAIVVMEREKKTMENHYEKTFQIISKGQNEVETLKDASAHAEMQSLRSAAKSIHNWRLHNATLYTTLEPCPMCLSAAQAFRISKLVYGAPDLRLGAVETHINLLEIARHPFHNTMEVVGGIRKEECGKIMVDFFRERRKSKYKVGEIKGIEDARNSKKP